MKITIKNLYFKYRKSKYIFTDLNLIIPSGKLTIIIGPNGSGKTTLLKLIAGILKPQAGEILYNDSSINPERIGYVFQNPNDQFVHLTVERELAFGLENIGLDSDSMKERVNLNLKEYNMLEKKYDSPDKLSGGEQQKLSVACSMIYNPEIILMDEPTSFLDERGKAIFYNSLNMARKKGKTIVMVSQQTNEVEMADYLIELSQSGVRTFYEPGKYLKNDIDIYS